RRSSDLLVLLAGVTYFFAIAQANGTVDRIIESVIKRIGDRAVILPFALFALTTGIAAMGAPLAGLVMMPISMPLAKKYDIDRVLMGLSVGSGISAGGFAPTSLFGIVTYGTAHSVGIPLNPMVLFAIALGVNILLDRKSTRLNSSHVSISYAVLCLLNKTTTLSNMSDGT